MRSSKLILPIIIISQFCCTSLWFAGNSIMGELVANFHLTEHALGHLTAAIQFGFIIGTLVFAILTIADRFSPSKVFFFSAIMGALFNLGLIWEGNQINSLLALRFATGFFLAGIYPIGMKIATDYFEKGLGKSLGFLVGALVLGTAFPHLLKSTSNQLPWKNIIVMTSSIALFGGLIMMLFVPDGPHRKAGKGVDFSVFFKVFRNKNFRAPAFGYFGHMWELYAFWAFTPLILKTYNELHPIAHLNVPLWSFCIIGIGGLSCALSGYIAQRIGTKRTAFSALSLSLICCLISPLAFIFFKPVLFLYFLLFWGMVVVADSPMFSTLVAQNAPSAVKGTALTIVNCIGFSITIISIQLINSLIHSIEVSYLFMTLAIGPFLGLIALGKNGRTV